MAVKFAKLPDARLADEIAATNPQVHVLHRTEKNGLGRAYLAGFGWALARDYEFIFEMDADFSHDPGHLPEFLAAIRDTDLVLVRTPRTATAS